MKSKTLSFVIALSLFLTQIVVPITTYANTKIILNDNVSFSTDTLDSISENKIKKNSESNQEQNKESVSYNMILNNNEQSEIKITDFLDNVSINSVKNDSDYIFTKQTTEPTNCLSLSQCSDPYYNKGAVPIGGIGVMFSPGYMTPINTDDEYNYWYGGDKTSINNDNEYVNYSVPVKSLLPSDYKVYDAAIFDGEIIVFAEKSNTYCLVHIDSKTGNLDELEVCNTSNLVNTHKEICVTPYGLCFMSSEYNSSTGSTPSFYTYHIKGYNSNGFFSKSIDAIEQGSSCIWCYKTLLIEDKVYTLDSSSCCVFDLTNDIITKNTLSKCPSYTSSYVHLVNLWGTKKVYGCSQYGSAFVYDFDTLSESSVSSVIENEIMKTLSINKCMPTADGKAVVFSSKYSNSNPSDHKNIDYVKYDGTPGSAECYLYGNLSIDKDGTEIYKGIYFGNPSYSSFLWDDVSLSDALVIQGGSSYSLYNDEEQYVYYLNNAPDNPYLFEAFANDYSKHKCLMSLYERPATLDSIITNNNYTLVSLNDTKDCSKGGTISTKVNNKTCNISINSLPCKSDDYYRQNEITSDMNCTVYITESTHCVRCNKVVDTRDTASKGPHCSKEELNIIKEPTCAYTGIYDNTCVYCNEPIVVDQFTRNTDNVWLDSEHTDYGSISQSEYDDYFIIPALGHQLSKNIISELSCTSDAYSVTTCSRCDYHDENIEKTTGHDLDIISTEIPQTCYSNGVAHVKCRNCNYENSKYLLPATNHNFVNEYEYNNSLDTEKLCICTDCGFVVYENSKYIYREYSGRDYPMVPYVDYSDISGNYTWTANEGILMEHRDAISDDSYISLSNSRMFELSPYYIKDIEVEGFNKTDYKIVPLCVTDDTYNFKLSENGSDDTGKIAVLIGLDAKNTGTLSVTQTLDNFKTYKLKRTDEENLKFEIVDTFTDSFSSPNIENTDTYYLLTGDRSSDSNQIIITPPLINDVSRIIDNSEVKLYIREYDDSGYGNCSDDVVKADNILLRNSYAVYSLDYNETAKDELFNVYRFIKDNNNSSLVSFYICTLPTGHPEAIDINPKYADGDLEFNSVTIKISEADFYAENAEFSWFLQNGEPIKNGDILDDVVKITLSDGGRTLNAKTMINTDEDIHYVFKAIARDLDNPDNVPIQFNTQIQIDNVDLESNITTNLDTNIEGNEIITEGIKTLWGTPVKFNHNSKYTKGTSEYEIESDADYNWYFIDAKNIKHKIIHDDDYLIKYNPIKEKNDEISKNTKDISSNNFFTQCAGNSDPIVGEDMYGYIDENNNCTIYITQNGTMICDIIGNCGSSSSIINCTTPLTDIGIKITYNGEIVETGQEYNPNDISIIVEKSDGTTTPLNYSDVSFNPDTKIVSKAGDNSYIGTYNNLTDTLIVPGYKKFDKLEAVYDGLPIIKGNDYNPDDVIVTIKYTDGTSDIINYPNWIPDKKTVTVLGDNTFTASYSDAHNTTISTNFTITGIHTPTGISAEYIGTKKPSYGESYSKDDVLVKLIFNSPDDTLIISSDKWDIKDGSSKIEHAGENTDTAVYKISDTLSFEADYSINALPKLTASYIGNSIRENQSFDKKDVTVNIIYDAETSTILSESEWYNHNDKIDGCEHTGVYDKDDKLWNAEDSSCMHTAVHTLDSGDTIMADYKVPMVKIVSLEASYEGPTIEVGKDYSKNDVIVKLIYDNSEKNIIDSTQWINDPESFKITKNGNNIFTANYESFTADYIVPGRALPVGLVAEYKGPSIEIGKQYNKNDVIVKLLMNDNSSLLINTDEWEASDTNINKIGDNIYTATYKDKTADFTVIGINSIKTVTSKYIGDPVFIGNDYDKSKVITIAIFADDTETFISYDDLILPKSKEVTKKGDNVFIGKYKDFDISFTVVGKENSVEEILPNKPSNKINKPNKTIEKETVKVPNKNTNINTPNNTDAPNNTYISTSNITSSTITENDNPKTGDSSKLFTYIGLLLICIISLFIYKKRK